MTTTNKKALKSARKVIVTNSYHEEQIAETYHNGFITVDHSWRIIKWNKAAALITGQSAGTVMGKNLWKEMGKMFPERFHKFFQKLFLELEILNIEKYWGIQGKWYDLITYFDKDTLSVSFKSKLAPLLPLKPERKLKILNDLYKYVTEVTNDCLWEWDLKSHLLFWIDGGHKRVFGYPIENVLLPQHFWESRIHPDDKKRVLDSIPTNTKKNHGSTWESYYRFRKANGDYSHVHDSAHIIFENGKPSRMIGATQDISSWKLSELHLEESERKLSLIARQTVNAVIITDDQEKIIWVNDAFTNITEFTLADVIGRETGSFLLGNENNPLTIKYLRKRIKHDQPFNCDIVNYTKSGRRYWMQFQGQALLNQHGSIEHYFALGTDITEKVLLENKLIEERLNRQKEITQAILSAQETERADIGKELHDNLNQILGAAKLYIEMAKTDDTIRPMALEKTSGYISTVIEKIRQISRELASPNMHTIGLLESIHSLIEDLITVYPIKIEFHKKNITEKTLTEKAQLNIFRIVQEQLNNILKHSKATYALIELFVHRKRLHLKIKDNGVGHDSLIPTKGVGIRNIEGRVEFYHGATEVITTIGEGYELNIAIPYPLIESV